eukprot:150957-Pleurochrysis_carterae.AAC.1
MCARVRAHARTLNCARAAAYAHGHMGTWAGTSKHARAHRQRGKRGKTAGGVEKGRAAWRDASERFFHNDTCNHRRARSQAKATTRARTPKRTSACAQATSESTSIEKGSL